MAIETRTARSNNLNPGIYLGKVVNHLDTTFMGGIEVEIVKRTESGAIESYVQCKYASPFYGQSPYDGLTDNVGYEYTQKSYGFWAVPPDPGTQVIVVMPEGDYSQAYWIGCVPDLGMNFMTPGNPATVFNDVDTSLPQPVGEYNKKTNPSGNDYTKYEKPGNNVEIDRLDAAGLTEDWARGYNSSSARREAPSQVYGWSTPGPVDMNGPKYSYGKPGAQIQKPYNRLGGSSIVMDDGDMSLLRRKPASGDEADKPSYASVEAGESDGDVTLPSNDLIRIRTRTGHQIVMHNTEEFIYISHGSGNSWIEMTGNGKIDIYAKDSISVHSETDINFTADRDINFKAGNNVNITSGQNIFASAGANYEIKAGADGKLTCAGQSNIHAATHAETATGGIFMNSSTAASEAADASIPKRVPQHEPWLEHENLDPQKFIPDETTAQDPNEDAAATDGTFPTLADTFRRPT